MGYTDQLIARNLPVGRAFYEILNAISARHSKTPLASLSSGERGFMLASQFHRLMFADGLHDYLGNTNCKHAHQTVRAFELVGMHKDADILRRALAFARVPDPVPADYIYDHSEQEPQELRKLEKEYYEAHPDIRFERTLVEYVRQHPEEFV
jgi:Domain of unknown function (DUF4375)